MSLGIEKYFSKNCEDPYLDPHNVINYQKRNVEIRDDSGNLVEVIKDAIFPSFWGQNAANTVATKYFRREGVPETGREIDLRQLVGRVSKTIAQWGIDQGYVDKEEAKTL